MRAVAHHATMQEALVYYCYGKELLFDYVPDNCYADAIEILVPTELSVYNLSVRHRLGLSSAP